MGCKELIGLSDFEREKEEHFEISRLGYAIFQPQVCFQPPSSTPFSLITNDP